MTRIMFAALVVSMVAAPAFAADRPLLKAAPAAVVAPWTGFFIGAHVGAGSSRKEFFDNFPEPDLELDADVKLKGGLGGLQAGYNHQFGWLVVGVEGEFSWARIRKNDFSCFPFGDQICSAEAQWFATVTGRIGAALGPVLVFVKGGPAWVHDKFTNLATCSGNQPVFADGIFADCGDRYFGEHTRPGWTIGGGVEYAISAHWSVKAEYNHMKFRDRSVRFEDEDGSFFTELIKQRIDVVKFGVNYRFPVPGVAPLPVKAMAYAGPGPLPESNGGHVLAFAGGDFGKHHAVGWLGTFLAPYSGLEASGFRAMIYGEGGRYRYFGDPGEVFKGTYSGGTVLAGYGFEGDNYSVNLMAGVNAEHHDINGIDPRNTVQGTEFGLKLFADATLFPTPQTLVAGEAMYSTAFDTYSAKAKAGFDLTSGQQVFLGPEVSVSGNARYDQWRVGGHLTQVKLGWLEIDLAAGYAHDSNVGPGAYGSIEVSAKF